MFFDPCDSVGERIATFGLYEADDLAAIRSFLTAHPPAGRIAVDVGANIGNHTLALHDLFERVISVEPNPLALHLLRANLLYNDITNVHILPIAAAETAGEHAMAVNHDGNLGASFLADDGDIVVQTARLDDVVPPLLSESERIGFMKLDIEGFELPALAGAAKLLQRDRPIVAFEAQNGALSGVVAYLRRNGYGRFLEMQYDGWTREQTFVRRVAGLLSRGPGFRLVPLREDVHAFRALVLAIAD